MKSRTFYVVAICCSLLLFSADCIAQQKQNKTKATSSAAKKPVKKDTKKPQKPPTIAKQCTGKLQGKKCPHTSIDGSGLCPKHKMLQGK